ncbi:MAG TPA: hypothetical protein VFY40_28290, partial [Blastocatellia bacterium]|nr:hypothetical protein [Blastocatellia bacterium]
MKPGPGTIRILWLITLLLVVIGFAAAIRRTLVLFVLSPAPPNFPEETGFARHPLLTMAHISPGLIFIALGPL